MGIENLKTALGFAIGLGEKIEIALSDDGKITWTEIFGFIPILTSVPSVIKAAPELVDEFKDLDQAEKDDLKIWLETELDLQNDKVESYIEKAFELLLALSAMIKLGEK
jgi:hypothetical protein